jgi:hypothetical protein
MRKPRRKAPRRHVNRSSRGAIIRFLAPLAFALLAVMALARPLGLSASAVDTLGDLFSTLLSMAALSLSHHSCRP